MSTGSVRSLQRIEADQFPTGALRRPRRRGLPASFGSSGVPSVCATKSGDGGRKSAAWAVGRLPGFRHCFARRNPGTGGLRATRWSVPSWRAAPACGGPSLPWRVVSGPSAAHSPLRKGGRRSRTEWSASRTPQASPPHPGPTPPHRQPTPRFISPIHDSSPHPKSANQPFAVHHQTLPPPPPDPTFPSYGYTVPIEASSPVDEVGHLAVILPGTGACLP